MNREELEMNREELEANIGELEEMVSRVDQLTHQIRNIEWPDVRIPLGIKELLGIVNHFSLFTDDQWERVIELARAFGGRCD